jgi:diguanylate cyclase (GGDEF)-like protein
VADINAGQLSRSPNRRFFVESKQVAIAVTLIVFMLAAILFIYISYRRQISVAETVANEFSRVIESDLHYNENFSDAVSVLYLRLKSSRYQLGDVGQEYDKQHRIYGINLFADRTNNAFMGTLQSDESLTRDKLLLARAVDLAMHIESRNSHYSHISRRYFLSKQDDFIYITSKVPLSEYVFKSGRGRGYGLFSHIETRGYLYQKLHDDPDARFGELSPVYLDSLSGDPVITVQHVVFDQSQGMKDKVLGSLCFDYQREDLLAIARSLEIDQQDNFLNIYLLDKESHTELGVLGVDNRGRRVRSAINDRYEVIVSIDPLRYYLASTGRSDLLILALLSLCFLGLGLIYDRILRAQRRNSLTDPLTGLYNRAWLEKYDTRSGLRARTIVMLDCNDFKTINDTWGHQMGDMALKHVAKSIIHRIQQNRDYAVRMGGDEFLITFSQEGSEAAEACMRRIAHDIGLFSAEVPLSVSYGVCELTPGMTLSEAMSRADSRMYKVKKRAKI